MHKLGDLCWYGYQRRTWAPTLGTLVSWKRVRTSFLVSVSRSHTRRDRHDCTLGLWKLFTVFVRRDSHPVLVLSGCGPGLTALESDGFGHGVRSRAGGAITKRCFTCFTSLMNLHGTPSEPVLHTNPLEVLSLLQLDTCCVVNLRLIKCLRGVPRGEESVVSVLDSGRLISWMIVTRHVEGQHSWSATSTHGVP